MGLTISYRGSLTGMDRVQDFADRVLDLALEVGGHARVWRSVHDNDTRRVGRGVMPELDPGQETTSLLVSPEGWLINLFEIEEAFEGAMRDEGIIDLPGEPPRATCWRLGRRKKTKRTNRGASVCPTPCARRTMTPRRIGPAKKTPIR